MNDYIQNFPKQLEIALKLGEQAQFNKENYPIQNVIALGMGGSGIGADFATEIIQQHSKVPFITCKGYTLPNFVGKNTLVIACSFSGNTEETIAGFQQALLRDAKIVCISSGGQLIEQAKSKGLDYIQLPNNGESPRACLGLSLIQQLYILQFFGQASNQRIEEVKKAATLLTEKQTLIRQKAERIAKFLVGKLPIIYTTDRMAATAIRLRQQLNENAKILCLHHIIPEMNHNELVGWRKQPNEFAVLIFRSQDDHPRNQIRIDINKEIISHYTNTVIEIFVMGDSLVEQALYAVHLGDWLSWEASQLRQVDAIEVKVIDYLKSELGKHTDSTPS